MKILLALATLTLSLAATAQSELPKSVKTLIFDDITRQVYFEDDGYKRMPQSMDDFIYTQTDESTFTVKGTSFSEWDNKDIGYDCVVEILVRGIPKTTKDINVTCEFSGMNWPN
jgi:hypothetical protein